MQTGKAVVKYQPALVLGYNYGLGVWIRDKDANDAGTVITSPGLYGSYPLIDYCRGYASLIFVKTLLNEQKKEIYDSLKDAIDKQISSNCK